MVRKNFVLFSACLLGILTHHIIFETNTHQHIKDASKETITTSSNANNKVLLRIDQTLKQQSTGSSTTSNKNNTKTKLVSDDSMVLITKSQPLPSIKEVKGNQKEFLDSKTGKAIIQKEVNSETTNSGINWTAVQAGVSLLAFMGLLITIRQQNKDLQIQHTDSKTQNNLLGLQREELTLQREELKLTREEMELQRQEMSGQKEQMEAQAKALQEQVNTAKTAAIIECYSDYYHNLRERLLGNQGEIIDNLNNFRGFFTNYAETADLIKQPNNFCNLTEECIEKAILRGLFNGEDYMNEIDECADKLIFICNLLPKDQTFPKIKFIKDTIMTIKTLESARIMVYSSVKKLTKQN